VSYEVVLENFSGPLDLLLHLIQRQEMNIHDIPIATVTEQYLGYLRAMEELSLDIASDFVVMAATLLQIKSRMLLPRPPRVEEEESELDPREVLVQQLLEYQRCKWAAEELKTRGLLQSQLFGRDPLDLRPYASTEQPPLEGVTMWDLVDAFRKLLVRIPRGEHIAEIKGHVVSVQEMMALLSERMRKWKTASFLQLIQFPRTRPEIVSGFLALLELIKEQVVRCVQVTAFGDIDIIWNGEKDA